MLTKAALKIPIDNSPSAERTQPPQMPNHKMRGRRCVCADISYSCWSLGILGGCSVGRWGSVGRCSRSVLSVGLCSVGPCSAVGALAFNDNQKMCAIEARSYCGNLPSTTNWACIPNQRFICQDKLWLSTQPPRYQRARLRMHNFRILCHFVQDSVNSW